MIDITIFSSRELALAVWITIVLTWMCFSQNLRNSLGDILAAFFKLKLQILFVGGYIYLALPLLLFFEYIYWDRILVKDCIVFVFITSIVMIGGAIEQKRIRNNVFDSIKATTLIAFYINVFTFSFIVEFILLPIVVFLSMTAAYAKGSINQDENKVGCLLESLTNIIYLGIIIYSGVSIYQDLSVIIQKQAVYSLTLPIIMTVYFTPYLFAVKVYSAYECFLVRLKASTSNSHEKDYHVRRNMIMRYCGLNLKKLTYVSKHLKIFMYQDNHEFENALRSINSQYQHQ